MSSSASFQPAAQSTTFRSEEQGVSVTVSTVVKVEPPQSSTPQAQSASSPALKPGYKTSEFWVTMVAQVVGLMTAMGVVSPAHSSDLSMAVNTIIGALLALLPAMAYIFNRTWLKTKSQPQQ